MVVSQRDLDRLAARAEEGEAQAQYELATLYREGDVIQRDLEQALKWYARAADSGHLDALNDFGSMLLNAMGCERDTAGAIACYRQAALKGHSEAQFNLALRYLHGDGVELDPAKAADLLAHPASAGHVEAMGQLGTLFMLGNGVEQSYEAAAVFHWLAADAGDVTSIGNLASYRQRLEELARAGVQAAALVRGHLFRNGWGDPASELKAFAWYRWAMECCEPNEDHAEELAAIASTAASLSREELEMLDAEFRRLSEPREGAAVSGS